MPAITAADWGRIYAYIWRDEKFPPGGVSRGYKNQFETDPAAAVQAIDTAEPGLNLSYAGNPPQLFDVGAFSDFTPAQLEAIMYEDPDAPAFRFFLRMTC